MVNGGRRSADRDDVLPGDAAIRAARASWPASAMPALIPIRPGPTAEWATRRLGNASGRALPGLRVEGRLDPLEVALLVREVAANARVAPSCVAIIGAVWLARDV